MGALLVLGLYSAIAPSYKPSQFELSIGADAGYWSLQNERSWNAAFGPSFTIYPHPVIDDDAPRSLQPFLQRRSSIQIASTIGGFSTSLTNNPASRSDLHTTNSAALDAYLTRNWALAVALSFQDDTLQPGVPDVPQVESYIVTAGIGIGLHIDDFRADLVYRNSISWSNGTENPVPWGRIGLTVRYVAARRAELTLSVSSVPDGIAVSGGLLYCITREIGLIANAFGSNGQYYFDTPTDYVRLGGQLGITWWLSRRFGASLIYQLSAIAPNRFDSATTIVENHGFATFFARFP